MTNYVGFINAMLTKRDQDIKAQMAAEQATAEGLQGIGSSLTSLGSTLGSAFKGMSTDATYNKATEQAMNTAQPPRAAAVDPNAPGVAAANATWGGATQPYNATGGKTEFDALMAASKQQNAFSKNAADSAWKNESRQMQVNRYNQNDPASIDEANRRALDQATKTDAANRQAALDAARFANEEQADFLKLQAIDEKGKPKVSQDQYDVITSGIQARRDSAVKAGIAMPQSNVPVYKTAANLAAEKTHADTLAAAQAEQQTVPGTLWGTNPNPAYNTAWSDYNTARQNYPSYPQPKQLPAITPRTTAPVGPPTAAAPVAPSTPSGARPYPVKGPDGRTRTWDPVRGVFLN